MARTSKRKEIAQRTEKQKGVLLENLKSALQDLSTEIRERTGHKASLRPILDYDGNGKLFEALITFELRRDIYQQGFEVWIHGCDGVECDNFVLRGSPGKIAGPDGDPKQEPTHFRIVAKDGRAFEMHNSVEWPDHHVEKGLAHEIDLSIASSTECAALSHWVRTKEGRLPRPSIAIEAKFRGRGLNKALGRELTGLALGIRAKQVALISSNEPDQSVGTQMAAIPSIENGVGTKARIVTYFKADGKPKSLAFYDLAVMIVEDLRLNSPPVTGFSSKVVKAIGVKRRKSAPQ
ncbi:hypothetical protein [Rhizobium sp. BK068]|uniref:hypothetical protein n=1 Tax=Rhizobium sp. BK068 TaxID=2512130 RepID=UPI0010492D5E|nr:hypothetical protein [Rhizobium sp. BK068]TCM76594.1 hypothetical protein EV291_10911 [Rhizobium sp. BK068]